MIDSIRILVVDDEDRFRNNLIKLLKSHDLEAVGAIGGEEALAELEKQDFDVVLLDIKMPGMDGIEALARIKSEFPLVEVIMLTGHATVESAIEGMKRGAFEYLLKPCKMEDLMTKILDAAAKKGQHEEKIQQARTQNILLRRGI